MFQAGSVEQRAEWALVHSPKSSNKLIFLKLNDVKCDAWDKQYLWMDRIGSLITLHSFLGIFSMSIMKISYLLRWCIPPWMEFMPLNMHSYFSALLLASWLMGFPWGFRYMSLKWWGLYICIYIYIYLYIYIYIYLCMYIYICIYVCIYIFIFTYFLHIYIYIFNDIFNIYIYVVSVHTRMETKHIITPKEGLPKRWMFSVCAAFHFFRIELTWTMQKNTVLGGGNSNIFYVHPYLGKWSILTSIFQMGWNHQLVDLVDLCQSTPPSILDS